MHYKVLGVEVYTGDLSIITFDEDLEIINEKRFDRIYEIDHQIYCEYYALAAASGTSGQKIINLKDGTFAMALLAWDCNVYSDTVNGDYILLVKMDKDFNPLKILKFCPSFSHKDEFLSIETNSMTKSEDGNIFILWTKHNGPNAYVLQDYYLACIDEDFNVLGEKIFYSEITLLTAVLSPSIQIRQPT